MNQCVFKIHRWDYLVGAIARHLDVVFITFLAFELVEARGVKLIDTFQNSSLKIKRMVDQDPEVKEIAIKRD
jgi:hypothetical protein